MIKIDSITMNVLLMHFKQMGFSDVDSDNKPQSFQQTYEQKRQLLRTELQQKEDEMRQQFVIRVKEKETELKEAEKEVCFTLYSISLKSLEKLINKT